MAKATDSGPADVLIEAKLARTPKYLVLFHDPSEKNTSTLSAVLGVGAGAKVKGAVGVRLKPSVDGGVAPRVFERIGVAATDLTKDQLRNLERDSKVRAVVLNEERRLPPFFEVPDNAEPNTPSAPAASEIAALMAEAGEGVPTDPVSAYLAGVRDGLNLALRARGHAGGASAAQAAGHSWCLAMIGLDAGYRKRTGKGVKVAVLDTGIAEQHPDFAGRILKSRSFVAGEGPGDGHGHGSHCAGVLAARAISSGGRRYSVAPDADLLIAKVLSNAGSGTDDQILEGIQWAVEEGARVLSMSLGSPRPRGEAYADVYETVAAQLQSESPGALLIAAAGNESERPDTLAPVGNPAACPSIMAVSAVDRQRRVASFACCGLDDIGAVDVSAPGVAVHSAWKNGGFKVLSGTSMATPHVAGVCALHLEEAPGCTAKQLWERVTNGLSSLGEARDFGGGLVRVP